MKNTILSIAALLAIGVFTAFSILPGNGAKEVISPKDDFKTFLKQFPKSTLPYTISKNEMLDLLKSSMGAETHSLREAHADSKNRLKDPNRFIPSDPMEMVSRVPIYKEAVARMATAEHEAVVFSISRGFSGPLKSFSVAVFDKSGKHLATHPLASTSRMTLTAGSIDAALNAVVDTYRIDWEQDANETAMDENTITGLTLESSEIIDLTKAVERVSPFEFKPLKKEKSEETIGAVFK